MAVGDVWVCKYYERTGDFTYYDPPYSIIRSYDLLGTELFSQTITHTGYPLVNNAEFFTCILAHNDIVVFCNGYQVFKKTTTDVSFTKVYDIGTFTEGADWNTFACFGATVIDNSFYFIVQFTSDGGTFENNSRIKIIKSPDGDNWSVIHSANGYELVNRNAVANYLYEHEGTYFIFGYNFPVGRDLYGDIGYELCYSTDLTNFTYLPNLGGLTARSVRYGNYIFSTIGNSIETLEVIRYSMSNPGTYTTLPFSGFETLYEVDAYGATMAIDPATHRPYVSFIEDDWDSVGFYLLSTNEDTFVRLDGDFLGAINLPVLVNAVENREFTTINGTYNTLGLDTGGTFRSVLDQTRTQLPIPNAPEYNSYWGDEQWDYITMEAGVEPTVENEFWTEEDQCVESTYDY